MESPHFILLFEGLIESKVYMNSPLERSVTINAISYFDILGDCKVRFMTQLDDMFLMSGAGNQEQAAYVATSDITFPHCLFRYGLNPLDNGLPIKYPSQYLENIYAFMQMAGQTDPKTARSTTPRSDSSTRRSCRSISATRRKRSSCSTVSNTSPTSTKRGMTGPPGRSPGCRKRTIWLQLSR